MIRAYVLIQSDPSSNVIAKLVTELSNIDGVTQAQPVTGPYDVILHVEAESLDAIGKLVVGKIHVMQGITRTLTCPVVDL